MKAWLLAHGRALADAGRTARRAPVASALSVLALAAALALPLVGAATLAAMEHVAARFDTDLQLSVFVAPSLAPKERDALERAVRALPGVKSLRRITPEQALAELQATEGIRDVLAGLPTNPLPETLVVAAADRSRVPVLRAALAKLPGVGSVQVDAAWAQRLEALVQAGRITVLALAGLLALALLAVTFNTIRLQVLTRADELDVAAIFGATRAWQRRPFLYFGALQGATAGATATALVAGLLTLLAARLAPFLTGAGAVSTPLGLTTKQALTAIVVSALLGWIGARLAVTQHLRPGVRR